MNIAHLGLALICAGSIQIRMEIDISHASSARKGVKRRGDGGEGDEVVGGAGGHLDRMKGCW